MLYSLEQRLRLQEQALRALEELAAVDEENAELAVQIEELKQSLEDARRERRNAELSFQQLKLYRRGGLWIYAKDQGLELRIVYDLN